MDFTSITGAIDFASVMTAIGAVGAAVAVVYVGIRGYRIVMGVLKR